MPQVDPQTPPKLRDRVERIVSSAIVSGELPAGEVVSTNALARELGISATPVREALLNLEKRGFVAPVKNVGFRVTQLDEKELSDIAAARRILEPAAMSLLAATFDHSRLSELRELAEQITTSAKARDLGGFLDADYRFHMELTAMLDNHVLESLIADLRSRTRLQGLIPLLQNDELDVLSGEHDVLLDLLATGDHERVRALMELHIGHILGRWSGHEEDSQSSDRPRREL